MAKVFELDFRKGSEVERYNNYTPSTYCPIVDTPKGKAIKSITGTNAAIYASGGKVPFGSGNWSIETYVRIRDAAATKWIFGQGGDTFIQGVMIYRSIYTSAVQCKVVDSATNNITASTLAMPLGKFCHIVFTADRAGNFLGYLNGVPSTPAVMTALTGSLTNTDISTAFMSYQSANIDACNGDMCFFRLYNSVLSQAEINSLYAEAEKGVPVHKPKRNLILNKPNDLKNISGLVAAYNMKPVGTVLTDISGNGNNGTVSSGVVSTKDGMLFQNTRSSHVTLPNASTLFPSTTYTFQMSIDGSNTVPASGNHYIFGAPRSEGSTYLSIVNAVTSGDIGVFYANNTDSVSTRYTGILTRGLHTIQITRNNTSLSVYIDGVLFNTYNDAGQTPAALNTYINNLQPGTFSGDKSIVKDLRIYNRVLSLQEIKDYHNSFVKPVIAEDFSDTPADNNANFVLRTKSLSREWEVTSGVFKVSELSVANGNLVTNPTFEGTYTDGLANGWSKYASAIVSEETSIVHSGSKAQRVTNVTSALGLYQFISFKAGTRYRLSAWAYLVSGSQASIGVHSSVATTYIGNGFLTTPGVWSRLSIEFFSEVTSSTAIYLTGTAGSVVVYDDVELVEVDPLPNFTKGTKYLECITAGIIATPSNTAYGTWEFDWYKGGDLNVLDIAFVNTQVGGYTSGTGYLFRFSSDEAIRIAKIANGGVLLASAVSYAKNNTWYRIKITRTTTGVFTVLIKGGNFTPTAGYNGWTLVSVIDGSGTNPVTDNTYTTSNYFVLDLDALDRIANICIYDGVKV